MGKTMKAVIKRDLSPGIFVEEIPIPVPKEGEVLIKVRAAGICGSDVHMYEGSESYRVFEQYMPLVPGHEFSGEIAEVGAGVTRVKPGDRVVSRAAYACGECRYCRSYRMHMCVNRTPVGLRKNGGFAEYVAVPQENCISMPDNMSFELGALVEPLGICGNAVNDSALTLGETVVVQGPGPIGLLSLLIARARGAGNCIMIGTSKDTVRLAKARDFGANHIIVADQENAVQRVLELTGSFGADIVIEASGVPQLLQSALDMCDRMGRVVVAGIYDGTGEISFTPMVRTAKRLLGTYGGPIAWDRMMDWLAADSFYGNLAEGVVTHRTRLEDAEAAFERSVKKQNIKELFVMD